MNLLIHWELGTFIFNYWILYFYVLIVVTVQLWFIYSNYAVVAMQ